ncbi:oxidoreductase family [Aureococcus anophagefferens]|nr:oxidoreductase family [Aureococcus anophagefferens]
MTSFLFRRFATTRAPAPVNVAIVGGGRMGEIRATNIAASTEATLAAFVDVAPDAARAFAARHGTAPFADLGGAAAAARGGRAARRGLGLRADARASRIIAGAAALGLHCAFQRRCDASYEGLRKAVEAGAAGALRSVRCTFRDHPTPEAAFLLGGGGDPYHDLATHDVDFVLSLIKCSQALAPRAADAPAALAHCPTEVYAVGASSDAALAAADVHDSATIMATWAHSGGAAATFDISRASAYGYDQRCEVWGDSGARVAVENPHRTALSVSDGAGVAADRLAHSFPERDELAAFVRVCRGLEEPKVSRDDAILATLVAEAALVSATRRLPVKIHEPGGSADRRTSSRTPAARRSAS